MFAMIEIKSNVFNVIFIVNRFAQNSSKIHMSVANDILDYLNIFDRLNIVYEKEDFTSQNYCDVNYDENLIIRKFIDVYVFIFNEESMNWMSKLQSIVIIFTCVAKYIVISAVTRKTIWFRSFFVDFHTHHQENKYVTLQIYIDNQSVKTLVENSIHHDRIKHVNIVYHYIRDEIKINRIRLNYIFIQDMLVDELIKTLTFIKFRCFIQMLSMS